VDKHKDDMAAAAAASTSISIRSQSKVVCGVV
jgi:hypothetical protein